MAQRPSPHRRRRSPLSRPAVFGTGRAGNALLRSLAHASIVPVVAGSRQTPGWVPRGTKKTRGLARTVDAAVAAEADVLFLAVSDAALHSVATRVAKREAVPPLVVHLSGSLGRDILAPLTALSEVATFHPLAALAQSRPIPDGTVIGINARTQATYRRLQKLAADLGLQAARVRDGHHARYHLAASVAANLPVALLDASVKQLIKAGLSEEAALTAAVGLMRSVLDNADALLATRERELGTILTGPVARGDLPTVARHLQTLEAGDLEIAYRALSRLLVDLSAQSAEARVAWETMLLER